MAFFNLPNDGCVVCAWPKAGAAVVDPNRPPVAGWDVCPNKDVPVEPNTGAAAKPVVAGFAKEPNGVVADVLPNPLPVHKNAYRLVF